MHRIRGIVTLLTAGAVAACTTPPVASDPGSPAASASAMAVSPSPVLSAPTPAPVSPVPSPSAPVTAEPSAVPVSSMEALLPNFAGGQYLTKQVLTGDDVLRRSSPAIFARMLEIVGAAPADIQAAAASGGDVDMLAISVRGVSGPDLLAGLMAAFSDLDDADVADLNVRGVDVRQVTISDQGRTSTLLLRTAGDALVIGVANGAAAPLVEEALATLLDPKLEALLPVELDGHPLTRLSMPGEAIPDTGDMCSMVCPGEPRRMAEAVDLDVTDVDIASAYSEAAGVSIVAFRFPGVATEALIPARQSLEEDGRMEGTSMTVGGKTVVRFRDPAFGIDGYEEWQYAHDDVLYIIRARPVEGMPRIVEAAVAALP